MTSLWIQFLACSMLIFVAGARLLAYGDAIARCTGLGGTWIGMALLATVTSLPELVSGVTAVTGANAPDLAVGDVLGSCVFNLALIALIDTLLPRASVFSKAGQGHIWSLAFGVLCLALVGVSLAGSRTSSAWAPPAWQLAAALVAIYALAMRTVFVRERKVQRPQADMSAPGMTLRIALRGYLAAAAVVVGAAIWLPYLAVDLATAMGWTEGFVGTLLVATTTSLPELAVTIAAVRRGALDLAIGNLLGSNLFNMVVLAIDTLLWLPADLLDAVSPVHLASILSALLMSGVVMVALSAPPRMRLLNAVSWAGAVLVAAFFVNAWLHLQLPR